MKKLTDRTKKKYLILCASFLLAISVNAEAGLPSEEQIVEWLKELKPLQKVHYSWHMPSELLKSPNDPRLYHYARLTHAISLRGEAIEQWQVNNAVRVCRKVNRSKPDIPCTLAINYSPWHRKFGDNLPATDFGKSYLEEIDAYKDMLGSMQTALDIANQIHNTDIELSAILLDSERFHVMQKRNDLNIKITKRHGLVVNVDEWNRSITQKHKEIFNISRAYFPNARIEQYERGGWKRAASSSGWMRSQWYTLDEPGETYSVSLYRILEIGITRETFARTVESAIKENIEEVTPYVALGAGQRRKVDKFHSWEPWDFDVFYSWQLGAELNIPWYGDRSERYAPWNFAKVIIFFPSPFAKRYPAWPKHFVAYVRGANSLKRLDDLEVK